MLMKTLFIMNLIKYQLDKLYYRISGIRVLEGIEAFLLLDGFDTNIR